MRFITASPPRGRPPPSLASMYLWILEYLLLCYAWGSPSVVTLDVGVGANLLMSPLNPYGDTTLTIVRAACRERSCSAHKRRKGGKSKKEAHRVDEVVLIPSRRWLNLTAIHVSSI